jgi:hypothetical protein
LSPDFDLFLTRIREEELHNADDEEYHRDNDKKVLELECYSDKDILYPIRTGIWCEEKILDWFDKSIEDRV